MNFEDFKKYRWFYTSSKKLVVGGKSSLQNDQLLYRLKASEKDYLVMHTESPGSPFCVILSEIKNVTEVDIKECAIFTACFSQLWKKKKEKAPVHIFRLSQVNKDKTMKEGTWGLHGKIQKIYVPLNLTVKRQKGIFRAVPPTEKDKIIITFGKVDKKDMLAKLELELNENFSEQEVLSALPSGPFKVARK